MAFADQVPIACAFCSRANHTGALGAISRPMFFVGKLDLDLLELGGAPLRALVIVRLVLAVLALHAILQRSVRTIRYCHQSPSPQLCKGRWVRAAVDTFRLADQQVRDGDVEPIFKLAFAGQLARALICCRTRHRIRYRHCRQ